MWTIEPRIPMSLWWALAAVSLLVLTVYLLRRDWSLKLPSRVLVVSLMAMGLLGPLVIALNPIWVEPIRPPQGKPRLTVLLDGTSSMTVQDSGTDAVKSRWQQGIELVGRVQLDNTEIDVIKQTFFSGDPQPLLDADLSRESGASQVPHGHRTDLARAIGGVIRDGSPIGHAVLLISDGAHNAGSSQTVLSVANEANSLATPIYTVTLGTQVGRKNLSVAAQSPRMIAFPDHPLNIRVRLGHAGLSGQSTELQLFSGKRLVSSQRIRLDADANREVRFSIPDGPTESLERYRIVATEVSGEATTADNQTTVLVQRLDSPIQVLLLEGKPYWDSKFLTRNLSSDPLVGLTSITKLGSQRFLRRQISVAETATDAKSSQAEQQNEGSNPNPKQEQWKIQTELASPLEDNQLLEQYRLVILGRDADRFLTASGIENLRTWLTKSGGCLICARGAPSNEIAARLAEILPVRWVGDEESRFRTRVSQYGVDTAVFDSLLAGGSDPLSTLPSLASTARPQSRRGLPQVLLQSIADRSGQSVPVVTYQPYGSGQSIVIEGAGMWRWAFLPPEHANKDKIYPMLWQSLIQWVVSNQDFMPGQQVRIRADRASFLAGDRVTASVLVRRSAELQNSQGQSDLNVLLQSDDQTLPQRFQVAESGLDEDLYQVDFGKLEVGVHSAQVVRGERDQVLATASIEVRDPWFEGLEVDARPDLMRSIAQQSGGQVIAPDQVDTIVNQFQQRLNAAQTGKTKRTTLWDRPLVLLGILGCWMTTWVVRRRNGLI